MEEKLQDIKKEIKEIVFKMLEMEHATQEYWEKEKRLEFLIEEKNKIFEKLGA